MNKKLDKKLEEVTEKMRETRHRLAGLEHEAWQPCLAMKADVKPNTKTNPNPNPNPNPRAPHIIFYLFPANCAFVTRTNQVVFERNLYFLTLRIASLFAASARSGRVVAENSRIALVICSGVGLGEGIAFDRTTA